jgi:hypothetical protein
MRSLIIGMGIGHLYKKVLEELHHSIVTVDLHNPADYCDLNAAIEDHKFFDCVFICTPNFTHERIAWQVAKYAKIVFVEKPGVDTASNWQNLVNSNPNTRFMMVKNNQYRDIIGDINLFRDHISIIDIRWINYDRVPNPGTWFTNKEQSFGGVSKDLMPHLLSFLTIIFPNSIELLPSAIKKETKQNWQLKDITNTNYGTVNINGIYNVDDYARLELFIGKTKCYLTADWRGLQVDDQSLQIILNNEKRINYNLGLCPEYAYKQMILTALKNINNKIFWYAQLQQDTWIHKVTQ